MAWERRNDCVGCETCHGFCRYKSDYLLAVCDKCGDTDQEMYEDIDGELLCRSCILSKYTDTEPRTICITCGNDIEESYDGMCEECFLKECDRIAETVR